MNRLLIITCCYIILQGCTHNVAQQTHQSFSAQRLSTGNLLYMEPDVSVKELGVAMAEEVPTWTQEGKDNLNTKMLAYIKSNTGLNVIQAPDLSPKQLEILKEHIALYSLVAGQHLQNSNGTLMPGWQANRSDLQLSLGPGLAFLSDTSGLDLGLMSVGEDLISSGGRVATQIAVALLFGAAMPGGHCVLHSGIVDLQTGDILWTNTSFSTQHSFRSDSGTESMVKSVFAALPSAEIK